MLNYYEALRCAIKRYTWTEGKMPPCKVAAVAASLFIAHSKRSQWKLSCLQWRQMENKATKINRELKEAAATAARLAQEWSRSRRE